MGIIIVRDPYSFPGQQRVTFKSLLRFCFFIPGSACSLRGHVSEVAWPLSQRSRDLCLRGHVPPPPSYSSPYRVSYGSLTPPFYSRSSRPTFWRSHLQQRLGRLLHAEAHETVFADHVLDEHLETCPVSTGKGTRRVRSVRGKGRDRRAAPGHDHPPAPVALDGVADKERRGPVHHADARALGVPQHVPAEVPVKGQDVSS